MNRSNALPIALLGCVALLAQPSDAQIRPALPRAKPAHYSIPDGWDTRVVTVKFRDGLRVRAEGGALTDQGSGALRGAEDVLERLSAGAWSRTHEVAEAELDRMREIGERNVGFALHDLNLQFRWRVPEGFDAELAIDMLNALAEVEMAEAIPLPALLPSANDYRGKQTYNAPAPRGTGATSAWGLHDFTQPGIGSGAGANVRIADIEYGFDAGHLDLPPVSVLRTDPGDTQNEIDHGTAVLGQIFALNDGIGTTGGAFMAQAHFCDARDPAGFYNVEQAISDSTWALQPGGVILIEQQIAGPHYSFNPTYPDRQLGLVPVEWSYASWIAIRNAVAYGVHVVEAAGNGNENLDGPDYSGLDINGVPINGGHWPFVPELQRDSGAILVGAGASPTSWMADRSRLSNLGSLGYEWGSNFGARVDVQAYGDGIVTTGYGSLYPGFPSNESYTSTFGGTSGASPSVTSAVAIVQARYLMQYGTNLLPGKLRTLLRNTGSPQTSDVNPSSERIGPRVDAMGAMVELHLASIFDFAAGFEAPTSGFGTDGVVTAMAEFDEDGAGPKPSALYIGGNFTLVGGLPSLNIAKWTGSGWEALGAGVSYGMPWTYNGAVKSMIVHDPDGAGPQPASLIVGGYFTQAGAVNAWNIARWSGTSWSALGSGLDNGVFSLASIDEDGAGPLQSSLIAGGDFTMSGALSLMHVARWRNNAWSALGSGFDDRVQALEVYDADDTGPGSPRLIAGGLFGNGPTAPIRNLATWNGANWSEFGGGIIGWGDQVFALESVPIAGAQQQILCVSGQFWDLGGMPANQFGAWTGSSWFVPANQPFNSGPFALRSLEDGSDMTYPYQSNLYASGLDVPASGPATSRLWKLDVVSWSWIMIRDFEPNTVVDALQVFDEDGDRITPPALYCGGGFHTAGNSNSANLAKLFTWAREMPMYCQGKVNSQGCVPMITSSGNPSASKSSGFTVFAHNVLNNKPGLLLYSLTGRASQPFNGGTLCLQAPLRRSVNLNSGGSLSLMTDCSGMYQIDMNSFAAGALGGNPAPGLRTVGQIVDGQFWGRDNGFPAPNNSALSNALEYVVQP